MFWEREGKSKDPFPGNGENKSLCSEKWKVSCWILSLYSGNGKVSLCCWNRRVSLVDGEMQDFPVI